jgi:hypothetical protein
MRAFPKFLIAAWLPLLGGTYQAPGDDSFLLDRGRAGRFVLGMSVDEVVRAVGLENVRLVATFPEGLFQPELQITLPGYTKGPALSGPIREFPCREFALWGISVDDPRFRTSDGLGPGSTLGDVNKRYPSARQLPAGSDGYPGAFIEELNLTFAIAATSALTDDARVTSVWVVPEPEAVRARRCPGR